MQNITTIKWLIIVVSGITFFSACKKAEDYYQTLRAQPEVLKNYHAVYGVGDTLTIDGRLNPGGNFQIKIGEGVAKIVSIERVAYKSLSSQVLDTIDRVKVVISQEMGIGRDRSITITSAGISINGTPIEIVESNLLGILPNALKLVKHADATNGTVYFYCQNGKGSIYSWQKDKKFYKLDKNGSTIKVLDPSQLNDTNGPFQIIMLNSGGIDPNEQYLYFSALTTDGSSDNAANQIYRLCRYDLQAKTLTTLNRTLLPKTVGYTVDQITPFEGSLGTTKLFNISGIYPGDDGTVYLSISTYAVARIDKNNQLKYLIHLLMTNGLPTVRHPQTNLYDSDYTSALIPGIDASGMMTLLSISPKEHMLYCKPYTLDVGVVQIDLLNKVELIDFRPPFFRPLGDGAKPFISGSFDVLTGSYDANDLPSYFGHLPMPDESLLILYYQGIDNNPRNKYYNQFPTFGILDLKNQKGRRYAPGKLIRNGYNMNEADKMLNYDEEGMIYMTANNNSVIVKTTVQ